MPREDRRLFFSNQEAYEAIYSLCGQKGIAKPVAGTLQRVDVNLENPMEIDLFIENSKTLKIEVATFTKDFVIAALMIMCQSTGTPIAKRANKGLEIVDEKLVLRVQILR